MTGTSTSLLRSAIAGLFFASGCVFAQIAPPPSTTCYATRLIPTFTAPANGVNPAIGTATPISVTLTDDCGTTLSNGAVTVSFSNGNPNVTLTGGANGVYTGSWTPAGSNSNFVSLTANASAPFQFVNPFGTSMITYTATSQLTASVGADPNLPLLFTGGVVSAVSFDPQGFVAPGAYVAIFGRGLADSLQSASSLPLPTTLGTTTVSLNGQPIPLNFVSAGQINAIIPFTAPTFGTQTLTVTRNGQTSNTLTLKMLAAEPAIISRNSSGSGQGTIVNGVTGAFADSSAPVRAGDVIVIYATGLGVTSPAVNTGIATPTDQLYPTAARVNVLIGNVPAQVIFSGLTPGFAGLYQINAIVPSGITAGDSVPVVVGEDVGSIAQRLSPTVTISVL